MQWVGYAELASAVSNAGGLGIVRGPRSHRTSTRLISSSEAVDRIDAAQSWYVLEQERGFTYRTKTILIRVEALRKEIRRCKTMTSRPVRYS